ncbi:MAG: rhodanese-like domain-containing protein [Planctomycetota bacterium]
MAQNQQPASRAALVVLGLALIQPLAACEANVSERDLKPAELNRILEATQSPGTVLIDARTPSAFAKGHIPGAVNLNIADVNLRSRNRPELIAADQIIVYGQNPGDPLATGLALRLLEAGYGATTIYRGGIDDWTGLGNQIQTPDR